MNRDAKDQAGAESRAELCAQDASALDALMENGWRGDASSRSGVESELERRLTRVRDVLALLDARSTSEASSVDPALVDVTMARVLAESRDGVGEECALSEDDAEALDAYVNGGYSVSRVAGSLRQRAESIDALGRMLTRGASVEPSGALVERTMQIVEEVRVSEPIPISRGRGGSFRLSDLASLAAVLVMGAGVLLPVFSSWSTRRVKTSCESNLAGIAGAFAEYAQDYRGSMPMASSSLAGTSWWDVGRAPERSNSANLFELRRGGYASLDELACSGNARASRDLPGESRDWPSIHDVSYSYYVMFTANRPNWLTPGRTVILADKSPVIARALEGQGVNPMENSQNHAGTGQWGLHIDGSATWLPTPMLGEDNIWLPADLEEAMHDAILQSRAGASSGSVEVLTREAAAKRRALRIQGNEAPGSAEDSFLAP